MDLWVTGCANVHVKINFTTTYGCTQSTELGNGQSLTDQTLAEIYLTVRLGVFGHQIGYGPIDVTVKHLGSDKPLSYTLEWEIITEKIGDGPYRSVIIMPETPMNFDRLDKEFLENNFFNKQMLAPFYASMHKAFKIYEAKNREGVSEITGDKFGPLPNLGEVLWETHKEDFFRAYLYSLDERYSIAYVRIPHYLGNAKSSKSFAQLIQRFEKESDMLIIDQLDNPGGVILYMYTLASMLSPQTLQVPKQRICITQEDVNVAINMLYSSRKSAPLNKNKLFGYPITKNFENDVTKYFGFIVDEWNAGRNFSRSHHLYGLGTLSLYPKLVIQSLF